MKNKITIDTDKEKILRNKVIYVRASEGEYEEIKDRAEQADMSASGYLIMCGLGEKIKKIRKAKRLIGKDREELEALMWQLKKLGRNINQLAHCYEDANLTGEGLVNDQKILQAGEKVKSLLKQLEDHL